MLPDNRRLLAVSVLVLLLAAPLQAALPEGFQLKGNSWSYKTGNDTLTGILIRPKGDGPFPGLVISHGKGGSVRGYSLKKAEEFAAAGFVCIACNYTHAGETGQRPGPGPAGAPGRGRFAPDDGASEKNIARAVTCLGILEGLPEVDPKRLYAVGHSMGGFVTIGLAARHPDRLQAAVVSGSGLAPRDGYPAPSAEQAKTIRTPFLMLHGSTDPVVRPDQSLALKEVLDQSNVPNDRHLFDGVGHNIDRDRPRESFDLTKAWFVKHGAFNAADAENQKTSARPPVTPAPEGRRPIAPSRLQAPPGVKLLRDIPYVDGGHERQKLDLYVPENPKGPLPLIVWVHGGGWQAGSKEQCFAAPWSAKGFAVASIGYRLSGDAPFPAQIEDCKAAIRYLRAHAKQHRLDPDRFAAWGSSAGGHLVALLGTSGDAQAFDTNSHSDHSSRVQAVIDFYGPTDLIQFAKTPGYESHARDTSPESKLLGGPVLQSIEPARKANPITYVDQKDPPFLIVHGDADPTVPLNQSESLLAALKAAGVTARLITLTDAKHGGPQFRSPQVETAVAEFLEQSLTGPR